MEGKFLATMTLQELVNDLTDAGLIIVRKEPATRAVETQAPPATLDFSDSSRYGCGLTAIKSRYHVSQVTAQRMKDDVLSPAIYQARRKGTFWIDYEIADAIMKERKAKKATNAQTVTA